MFTHMLRAEIWSDYNPFTFFFFAHYPTSMTILANRSQAGDGPVMFTFIFCGHCHTISSLNGMKYTKSTTIQCCLQITLIKRAIQDNKLSNQQQFNVVFKLHSLKGFWAIPNKQLSNQQLIQITLILDQYYQIYHYFHQKRL